MRIQRLSDLIGTVTIPGDAYYSQVALLMHFDGNLVDSSRSPKSLTAYGSAAATGAARFGSSSLSLNGATQYLMTNASADFALSGDFVIEASIYFTAASASFSGAYGACVCATYPDGGSPNSGWQLRINGTSTDFDTINLYTGTTDLNWSASVSLNEWHHVAVARDSGTIRAYLDGAQVGSSTSNSDDMTPSSAAPLSIGRLNVNPYYFYFPGRIDELRITNGSSRGYTGSTIAVPTQSFPDTASARTIDVVFR